MLPIDMQAEIIRSFQEEKRNNSQETQANRRLMPGKSLPWRMRALRASGGTLISIGRSMQRAAGVPLVTDRRLGWEK